MMSEIKEEEEEERKPEVEILELQRESEKGSKEKNKLQEEFQAEEQRVRGVGQEEEEISEATRGQLKEVAVGRREEVQKENDKEAGKEPNMPDKVSGLH